ncbi:type I restriction-modification enzyme R subunit C-terminal domain-containing protein [Oceanisphaera sp. IT1-181]|uniref:type I restriction-modification enzyme R subunit C-terminal domain-containing protein n=1 Tax=Oceanisphaera sp. IT1-181 TaxID=3081199 RepID=UPI0029CA511A|nr:type I restriction-modification enzyme R subunit C-terminal domain-containing protein [Oceanisphaera sp. IT1-181]
MQWRNIKGQSEALQWDLQITELQLIQLANPSQLDVAKESVLDKVQQLSMHINQVRAKAEDIKTIQQTSFWKGVGQPELEAKRQALRSIIHWRDKTPAPTTPPQLVLDITETPGGYQTEERLTNIVSVDYQIYRQQVEATLAPLFESNAILNKIRSGTPVTPAELDQLNALVHVHNPNLDLSVLKEFFPDSTVGVDQLLRTIVGMNTSAVEAAFTQFVQTYHTSLSSNQQRFIELLKNHLCRFGTINVAELYEQPFISVHSDGLEGVFSDRQADALCDLVKGFGVDLGKLKPITNVMR